VKKQRVRILLALLGAAGIGLLLLAALVFTAEEQKRLSGWCFGLGAAAAALGWGRLAESFLVSAAQTEESRRAEEIERRDERNIRVRERAGYMACRVMGLLLLVLTVILGLASDVTAVVVTASLILGQLLLVIGFQAYYYRHM
jgi:uncharacterized membrane protein